MKKFSLVIPCYNEAKSLPTLVDRAIQCATRRGLTPAQFELVVVDNGSSDGSGAVIEQLMRAPFAPFLSPVKVETNRGYGFGVYSGLKAATGGTLAWTHADEQCDPEDAFVAWERLNGRDIKILVKGRRYERALRDRFFSFGFQIAGIVLLNRSLSEINAQPKVFDRSLFPRLTSPPDGFPFDLYVLLIAKEAGWTLESIPVRFPPRAHGQSRWAATFRSKMKTILGMLQFMWQFRTDPSYRQNSLGSGSPERSSAEGLSTIRADQSQVPLPKGQSNAK